MAEFLDSSALRVVTYGVVALLAAWWGIRERRTIAAHGVDWWPFYWFLSAILLLVMGAGRVGGLGDLVSEFGREQARSGGWYDTRRNVQAVVVIGVAVAWFIGVAVAVLRVPPRRRRYLPHIVVLSTIIAFAAIRLVSLHQVDTVLYRRDVAGVRIVSIAELFMLVAATVVMITTARFSHDAKPADSPEPDDQESSRLENA
jgi:hypothetical protein